MDTRTDATRFFWDVADQFLADPETTIGTLMGFPCLRVRGAFFATCDHRSGDLIVKLPRPRVAKLTAGDAGQPFAPAGRTFKEWVLIADRDLTRWRALLDEARHFVGGQARAQADR